MQIHEKYNLTPFVSDFIFCQNKDGRNLVTGIVKAGYSFDENGKISPRIINDRTLSNYAQAAQAIAKETRVPFIDLNSISIEHHNKIGPEASAAYNFNESDTTHFSKEGAKAIAHLIIKELKVAAPELVHT